MQAELFVSFDEKGMLAQSVKDPNAVNRQTMKYSKTCVERPLKNRRNKDLNDKW